jgi:hypothetical protein
MRRAVAGREASRDNERSNMAAVLEGLPRAPRLDDERRTSGSGSSCTRSGRANNRLPKDRKSMRRRIRGEQGRNPGLRPDQARVRRRLPRWKRNDPPRRCSRARSGPWADRLPVPLATAGHACPSAHAIKLWRTGSNRGWSIASPQEAQSRCPGAAVVWVNEHSHIYHFAGTRGYGNTKRGAYMCEADAQAAGNRAAKNESHP